MNVLRLKGRTQTLLPYDLTLRELPATGAVVDSRLKEGAQLLRLAFLGPRDPKESAGDHEELSPRRKLKIFRLAFLGDLRALVVSFFDADQGIYGIPDPADTRSRSSDSAPSIGIRPLDYLVTYVFP